MDDIEGGQGDERGMEEGEGEERGERGEMRVMEEMEDGGDNGLRKGQTRVEQVEGDDERSIQYDLRIEARMDSN